MQLWRAVALLSVAAWTLGFNPAVAATYNVSFGSFFFSPSSLTIDAGDTVVWNGPAGHTVTGTGGGDPFCGNQQTTSCSRTFNTPGTFTYQCNVGNHAQQGMVGVITVRQGNRPPSIQISAGSSLTVTRGGTVTINVTASDPEGAISKVELFAETRLLATSTTAPYTLSASTGSLSPGAYELTAVVTDGQGAATTSAAIPLTVQPAPTIRFTGARRSGADMVLSWTGGVGPFAVQFKQSMSDPSWADLPGAPVSGNQTTLVQGATLGALYFRIRDAGQQ